MLISVDSHFIPSEQDCHQGIILNQSKRDVVVEEARQGVLRFQRQHQFPSQIIKASEYKRCRGEVHTPHSKE